MEAMLGRALLIATVAAVVASAQVPSSSNQMPSLRCDDVTKLDVRNLSIRTAQRTFDFHNGIAVNYDSPPEQEADWKAEIEDDSVILPAPSVVVRFLLIHDSHATGTGWR